MAGAYPDVPGHRMAYDRDGSIGTKILESGAVTTFTANQLRVANSEGGGVVSAGQGRGSKLAIVFPELRDIEGFFVYGRLVNGGSAKTRRIETSSDTTNGEDGSWSMLYDVPPHASIWDQWPPVDKTDMRNGIISAPRTGVRGIRSRPTSTAGTQDGWHEIAPLHIYGSPSSGAAPDRLRIWHPTLDEEVDGAYFDWGDVPRATELTKTFRVKNPSASLTANSVGLTNEALTDTTPSNVSAHEFSDDGSTFAGSLDLGNLGPGATSGIVTVRRTTPAGAALALWWTRVVASASSWS